MIEATWRRIAGFHAMENGEIGCVWLALDVLRDVVHVYDAAYFKREVMAVIGEGIAARGRWIPMAWNKDAEKFADELLERGINMLPDPSLDKEANAEIISREIWQRMRSSRFRVDKRVGEWLDEFRTFYRDDSKIPETGYPLMAATRHAIEQIAYAKPQSYAGSKKPNHPNVPVI